MTNKPIEGWEEDFNVIFGTDKEFALGDNSVARVKVFIKDLLASQRKELMKCVPEKYDAMVAVLGKNGNFDVNQQEAYKLGRNDVIDQFKENLDNLISTNERREG